ncbi:branched-chain amino acid ABC transporter substrate-binding protein [Mesorhizobium retamae]|uniref:Branched-chain amino acid ABC transporter substrate-binding protein n=1 Tax=Mesorhizobium retamae TaxID=2912854 RepID=A0ABS9QCX4_9HYPH|nr:branched-chain amino acid ABC transporter substrate-binding protein [Mesorhizobium sp. IRAMC:0171]MCG7505264.1 branched-chain amino acid ABC transporter substrate-binding protein [Mesorhizobium sp. IRAMC:0171]
MRLPHALIAPLGGLLAGLILTGATIAAPLNIGVAAPLTGSSTILGRQIEYGIRLGAGTVGAETTLVDDRCNAEGGAAAAAQFVSRKVDAVVGFLCTEAIEAAMPILKQAGIPVITLGVRTESLTDRRAKTGWPVFRLGPRGDAERDAAGMILSKLWRQASFAVVDDGTIYGRELAEAVRVATQQAALKPVFTDTFRPELDNQVGLVGRLRKAGADAVFVGGDGRDVAIMARDAAKLGSEMVFAGGEALREAASELPYATGTLMIAMPEWADVADKKTLDLFSTGKLQPEGYALPAFAAVEILDAAKKASEADGKPLPALLSGRTFTTSIGPVAFDQKGDLTHNPYRAFRFDGTRFVPLEEQ